MEPASVAQELAAKGSGKIIRTESET